jgi:hypothetical protein
LKIMRRFSLGERPQAWPILLGAAFGFCGYY